MFTLLRRFVLWFLSVPVWLLAHGVWRTVYRKEREAAVAAGGAALADAFGPVMIVRGAVSRLGLAGLLGPAES